jgi:glycosyltransferase involved in cell wall biosynthesis
MTRVTLLGFTVPDDMLRQIMPREPTMPVQTHTFAWAVVAALHSAGCDPTLLSVPPVSTFPRYPRLLFGTGPIAQGPVEGRLIPFVNLPLVRHATRFLGGCWTALPALRRWHSDVLLVHGVHSAFLWLGVLARAVRPVRVVAVLTDAPGVSRPGEPRIVGLLRRVDVAVVRAALRRLDGVVAVTADLACDFAPGRPWLLMEGIRGADEAPPRPPAPDTFDIAYSGGLTRAYGVDRLVRAVRALPDPRIRLLLYGRGDLEPWLREQALADPRIQAPQFVPREALAQRLRAARLLVNPRPVGQDLARYGFPSKLLDYLACDVPVLTTALPGIPAAYRDAMLFAGTDTATGLGEAIARALAMPAADARALTRRGAALLRERCHPDRQGVRLRAFLEDLTEPAEVAGDARGDGSTAPARTG